MASIVLKTFKGGNVSPLNDAILWQTSIPGAGIFKGCEVTAARGNILHISQGYGIIKGRFFEVYENEVSVNLAETGQTLNGRLYIHMDLSNADEPIKIMTETAETLSSLLMDQNVNYNNSSYDLELAVFKVDAGGIRNLTQVFPSVQGGAGGGGGNGGAGIMRDTAYDEGDLVTCGNAPGWAILVCTQSGTTALTEPIGYTQITKGGDMVLDGNCVFTARDLIAELDNITLLQDDISEINDELELLKSDTDAVVIKVMSVAAYKALGTYDQNTIYYCYNNETSRQIVGIYLGQHTVYATGVTVNYHIDTSTNIQKSLSLSDDAIALAPTAALPGFTFVGWRNDTTPNTVILTEKRIDSEAAVNLYAVFKRTITIDMDSMDADLPDGAEETTLTALLYYNNGQKASEQVVVPQCPYVMEDKSFCGWTINPNVAESYVPGESYSFTDDATLYPCFVDTDKEFDDVFNSCTQFRIPATGIYEFECWGAEGGTAKGTIDGVEYEAKGGKGGYAKVYRKMSKGTMIYIYNGFHPDGVNASGNRGGAGYSYTSSKHIGACGGGCTEVALTSYNLNSVNNQQNTYNSYKNQIIVVAGGGGGGGISATDNPGTATTQPKQRYTKGAHPGGYAGGERGQDGSSGSAGGGQVTNGYYDYTGWGQIQSSGSNTTYSGGGSGWYGGDFGVYGNSGAGGSSYVGNSPTFTYNGVKYKTVNQANNHEGHGKTHIRYMGPCVV